MAENENIINEAMPVEEKAVEETPVMEAPAKKAPKAPKQKPVPASSEAETRSRRGFRLDLITQEVRQLLS